MKRIPKTATDLLVDLIDLAYVHGQFATISHERYEHIFSKSTFNRRIKELADAGYVNRHRGSASLHSDLLASITGAGKRIEETL